MVAASPLTDPAGPSVYGPLVDRAEPGKKPAPTDAASSDIVRRVREAIAGARTELSAPAQDEMPKFPEMRPLPPPPKREDTPPIEAWGSLAMLAAALGGARSRTHATTALNAAGAALQGLHQRDEEKFRDEMERWKIATDNAQRMQSYEIETYKAIMGQRAQTFNDFIKRSQEEQREITTELHAQTVAQGNERVAALLEHQQWKEAFDQIEAQRKANESLMKERDKIASIHTMQSDFENALKNEDPEAKADPNAWRWKYYPEAAEKAGVPKPDPKSESDKNGGSFLGGLFSGGKITSQSAPIATPQSGSVSDAVTMLNGRPSVVHNGKRLVYRGTGDYDDLKNWEPVSPNEGTVK